METNIPRMHDAPGEYLFYDEAMIRTYISTAKAKERSALHLVLPELNMEIVGEASDWFTTLARAPSTNFHLLLVDWDLLPKNAGAGIAELRQGCISAIVVVLISDPEALQQVALSAGVDAFINKDEGPNRLAEQLQSVVQTFAMNEMAT